MSKVTFGDGSEMELPEDDGESLIPDYIELTEDEQEVVDWIEAEEADRESIADVPNIADNCRAIIQKLVDHIEKQNDTIASMVTV